MLNAILANECSFSEYPDLKSELQLTQCAKSINNNVQHMDLSIGGINIPNLNKYRATSQPFNFTFSNDNIAGVKAGKE